MGDREPHPANDWDRKERRLLLKKSNVNALLGDGVVNIDISVEKGEHPGEKGPHQLILRLHTAPEPLIVATRDLSKKLSEKGAGGTIQLCSCCEKTCLLRSTRTWVPAGGSHWTLTSFTNLTKRPPPLWVELVITGTHWPRGNWTVVIRSFLAHWSGSDQSSGCGKGGR
jgi:hypothetical protein